MDLSVLLNNKWMIIGSFLVFVILAFIGYYIVSKYTSNKTVYTPNNENTGSENMTANRSAELYIFKTSWCPFCVSIKPTLETIKEKYDGKIVNGVLVKITEVDCTEETAETSALMDKYDIKGYPTIKLIKPDDTVVDFEAKPTVDSLDSFINSVL